ncbi:hypothetical protein Q5425_35180 [Amycolatopsis sp. A133]|uniref:hypothetical protein n=1 Tax=Amycolatopsis sp. A133 TaxID=3064472 RepID=UPI0027F5205D|nr:hypothetical protein [Amycolatopsis sp. A133]MDQ7809005.1 hypothetical protein [Amycolatopsis sp. A133]
MSPTFQFDVELNEFFRSPEMAQRAQLTQQGYARDVAAFLSFLSFLWASRDRRVWRDATEADHLAYLTWRRHDPAGPRVSDATWWWPSGSWAVVERSEDQRSSESAKPVRRVNLDSGDEAALVGPAYGHAEDPDALAVQLDDDVADRRRLARWPRPDDEPGPVVWWRMGDAEVQLEPRRPVRVGFQAGVAAGGVQPERVVVADGLPAHRQVVLAVQAPRVRTCGSDRKSAVGAGAVPTGLHRGRRSRSNRVHKQRVVWSR